MSTDLTEGNGGNEDALRAGTSRAPGKEAEPRMDANQRELTEGGIDFGTLKFRFLIEEAWVVRRDARCGGIGGCRLSDFGRNQRRLTVGSVEADGHKPV